MYAQSYAVHWTQEYDQEERPTRRLTHALLCWTLQNNISSGEFKWIYRVWHEKV